MSELPELGPRIRAERTRRDVTIRALARDIGVSPSLISQIETGKSKPSVSTLYAITSALGLAVEDLFDVDGHTPSDGQREIAGRVLARERDDHVGPFLTAAEHDRLTLESGVTWQRLGQVPNHHVDFLLVTYPPGSSSSADGRLMRHNGTEYGYLISGRLEVTLGFESFTMHPGDSVAFESTTPHGYRNGGAEPAVGVWFVTEPG